MSGPKSSRYTLTPEQRRILAEQQMLERRKAVAKAQIKRSQKRLLQIGGTIRGDKKIAAELLARTGQDHGASALISELDALLAPVQPLVADTDYGDVAAVEKTAAAMKDCLTKAESLAQQIAAVSGENQTELKSSLYAVIGESFSASFADIAEVSTTDRKAETKEKLCRLKKLGELPQAYMEEIDGALKKLESISDESFLKNLIALTVNPLIRKVQDFAAESAACRQAFEELYGEYTALCELYYYVAQVYPCCKASIDTLRGEIQRIKEAVSENDEQAYISDCLDEVMEEMGYNVLGHREVTKKNGKRFRNELYTYGEGTVVNVTYASDGRIAMELGGVDTTDRLPDDHEAAALCASMEKFCGDFKEIERRLLARGVVPAQRISMLPPSAEYAQIINTTDYEMTGTATAQIQKRSRGAAKRKALRKE